ncbi:MAG: YecH family protein [Burkholderiales bacterium]|jgi:probable metal-binding protein|nr:YecH family protein [Burkholderiales bacterium]
METKEATTVHGHEVIKMVMMSNRRWTRDELVAAIHQKFGADTHFHTCADDDLTADELLDFLESRGKFVDNGEGLTTDGGLACNH